MTKKKPAVIKIDVQDTADIEVLHPGTGNPLPDGNGGTQSITIYGPESDVYTEAMDAMLESRTNKQGREKNLSSGQKIIIGIKFLVAITKSFNNLDIGEGPIDAKDAKQTYLDHKWLRNLIDTEVTEYGNFT